MGGRYPVAYRGSESSSGDGLSKSILPDPRLALLATPAIRRFLAPELADALLGPIVIEDAALFAPLVPLAPELVIGAVGAGVVAAMLALILRKRGSTPVYGVGVPLINEAPTGYHSTCNIGGSGWGPIMEVGNINNQSCGDVQSISKSILTTARLYWYGHPDFVDDFGTYRYYDHEAPDTVPENLTKTMVLVRDAGAVGPIRPFVVIPSVFYPYSGEAPWEAFVQALDPFLLPLTGLGVLPLPLPFSELPGRLVNPWRVDQRQVGPSADYERGVGTPLPDFGSPDQALELLPFVESTPGRAAKTIIAEVDEADPSLSRQFVRDPPTDALPAPAPPRAKQRKPGFIHAGSNKGVQLAGFSTEVVDLIEAAWDALPKADQTPVPRHVYKDDAGHWHSRRMRNDEGRPITHPYPGTMLQDLWNNWRDVDFHKFSDNAADAFLIDALFGVPARLANEAFVKSHEKLGVPGPSHGLGLGPVL